MSKLDQDVSSQGNEEDFEKSLQVETKGQFSSLEEDNNFIFVSTLGKNKINLDGNIQAYGESNKLLWKINLGAPLITSNMNPLSVFEKRSIIPGFNGSIYYYSEDSDKPLEVYLK